MGKPKVLVTTRSFRSMPGAHQQILFDAGCEIVNSPYDRPLAAPELADLVGGIDAAILGVDDVSAEVFEKADRLRIVSRYGVGVDKVDIEAATAKGIIVTNTPGGNTNAVAELTLGFMLALARNIPCQDRQIRAENWSLLKGAELDGKTLGLVGMGRIGQRVTELANAFRMNVIFHDPYPPAENIRRALNAELCSLEEVLLKSDFISLHLPLMPETRNLIDVEALARTKRGVYLVNTARGGIVDEAALAEALKSGHVAGAAFDVFETEPCIGNPLIEQTNFISTPHIGSSTMQTTLRMGLMASQNVVAVLNGKRPEFVVNPQVYDGDKLKGKSI